MRDTATKILKITLLMMFFSFLPTTGLAGTITFTDADDTHITRYFSSGWGSNEGSSTVIKTANEGVFDTYGLIKFNNVFGSDADQINGETSIVSAELHLWMSYETPSSTPNTINTYQLTKDWDENSVTGGTYGNFFDNVTGAPIDTYTGARSSDPNDYPYHLVFNVTESLLDWQSTEGATNYGWGIQTVPGTTITNFFSTENTMTEYAPYMVINYESSGDPVPEPATMLLFGTGLAALTSIRMRKKVK